MKRVVYLILGSIALTFLSAFRVVDSCKIDRAKDLIVDVCGKNYGAPLPIYFDLIGMKTKSGIFWYGLILNFIFYFIILLIIFLIGRKFLKTSEPVKG